MTQATKHTPTPWIVGEMGSHHLAIYGRSKRMPICQFGEGIDDGASELKNAEANAAHIVRCVNAHDELVAALEKANEALRETVTKYCTKQSAAALTAVRAALAKVAP